MANNIIDLDKFRKSRSAVVPATTCDWLNTPSTDFMKAVRQAATTEKHQNSFRPKIGIIAGGVMGDPMSEITLQHYAAGFETRSDYFVWLAKRLGVTFEQVKTIALVLGTRYDFDKLPEYWSNATK